MIVAGSPPRAAHLAFRDELRRRPELARRYAALERELAERHGSDRLAYTEAKNDFVASVLAGAGPAPT